MSLILPAISGTIGKTNYYALTMKAGVLVKRVRVAEEDPDWDRQNLEQHFQRSVNHSRVKRDIAPYFANNSYRFSNTVIIAIRNFAKGVSFKPSQKSSSQVGRVTIDDDCTLIPIDGQHRVLAIKYAISGKDELGNAIKFVEKPTPELAEEDIPVILVPFANARARAIFSAVNQYAKRTTVSENILLGDELTQKITRDLADAVFDKRLVKTEGKGADIEDVEITTLSSLHSCVKDVFDVLHPEEKDRKGNSYRDVTKAGLAVFNESVEDHFRFMLDNNDFYRSVLANSKAADSEIISTKKKWLMSRAMVQECLFKAFALLIADKAPFYPEPSGAARALNHLPLRTKDMDFWKPFLFSSDGKVINKRKKFIAEFMIYLVIGSSYKRKKQVEKQYQKFFPGQNKKLPPPVV